MGKHHFMPVPPKNWPMKKKIGRREGCRVVVEWRGATSDVWELLRELNIRFNHLLIFSCADFYLLERAHMYCRTFQEGSMPMIQRHKLVYLNVVEGEGHALVVEESPIVRADREKKEFIKFIEMEKLRIAAKERKEKKEFMKKIHERAEKFRGPTKSPMESLSMHRRMPNVHFGGGLKFLTGGSERNDKNGPGSFVKPSAFDQQRETRKRNMRTITSLYSTSMRESPEKAVPLGMREGPGPAHYVHDESQVSSRAAPRIKLGPGFVSGKETPERIVCQRLYKKWLNYDHAIEKETLELNNEMERIKKKEREVLVMARGFRNIQSEKNRKRSMKDKKKRVTKKM